MVKVLDSLFESVTGCRADSVVKLTGDGSNRSYYRMRAGEVSLIGAVGTCVEENRAFIAMSEKFIACGVKAPRVLAVSDDDGRTFRQDRMFYLEDDLTNGYCYPAILPMEDSFLVAYYHSNDAGFCLNCTKLVKISVEELKK